MKENFDASLAMPGGHKKASRDWNGDCERDDEGGSGVRAFFDGSLGIRTCPNNSQEHLNDSSSKPKITKYQQFLIHLESLK